MQICDALPYLAPIVQFNKREKLSWRSNTFNKVAACNFNETNTPP